VERERSNRSRKDIIPVPGSKKAGRIDLRVHQLALDVETKKNKDNIFL
jgi:hypothetical protein